jgi:hypothetical protein
MRYFDGHIGIVIELLPSLNPALTNPTISTAVLAIYEEDPKLIFQPIVRSLVDQSVGLCVFVNGVTPFMASDQPKRRYESVLDEVHAGRLAALDYMIISHIHLECENGQIPAGWVLTHISKHIDRFSVSFITSSGDEIEVGLSSDRGVNQKYSKFLRTSYLAACGASDELILLARFTKYLAESS